MELPDDIFSGYQMGCVRTLSPITTDNVNSCISFSQAGEIIHRPDLPSIKRGKPDPNTST